MRKSILFILLLFGIPILLTAQSAFGVRSGLGLSTWKMNNAAIGSGIYVKDDIESKIGFLVGGFYEQDFMEYFKIQFGADYVNKGNKLHSTYLDDYAINTFNYKYIDLNILIGIMPVNTEKFSFTVFLGPSFGYLLGGENVFELKYLGDVTTATEDIVLSSDSNINRIDWMAKFGIKPTFKINAGDVFLDLRYHFGFNNVNMLNNGSEIKNRNLFLSIGYQYVLYRL